MDIFPEALEHFQNLLRFDTTNPPGDERECVQYIHDVLVKEGLQPKVFESADKRANLVVRISGDGTERPLLINSHVDVVHADADKWKHRPFSGVIQEDCVWGRGAVDMKNMTAYCLATMMTLARQKTRLKRDVIMTVVADEETGGDYGMGFLAANHRELIDAEYALGELGGYTVHMRGKLIYPIQVGEKGIFWIKIKFTGSPGHGSIPTASNVHFRAARFLEKVADKGLPFHLTRSAEVFFNRLAGTFGLIGGMPFHLMKTGAGPRLLREIASRSKGDTDNYWALAAMISNTANPTGIEAGKQHNVVPGSLTLKLDCRLLPGFTGAEVIVELKKLTGEEFEVEVVRESPGYECPADTPLFNEMAKQIAAADAGAVVVPNLTVGYTDAQHLQKFGTICYGFTPIKLPPELNFPKLYHGHNERIPVEGFRWGLDVFVKTVQNFCKQ